MNVNQTKKDIKKAISSLPIPRALKEEALQEGFIAVLEGKDIKKHVRAWLNPQLELRQKLGVLEDKEYALQQPSNHLRRISKANPSYTMELDGDEARAYEII
jgi:hypothetical protein